MQHPHVLGQRCAHHANAVVNLGVVHLASQAVGGSDDDIGRDLAAALEGVGIFADIDQELAHGGMGALVPGGWLGEPRPHRVFEIGNRAKQVVARLAKVLPPV